MGDRGDVLLAPGLPGEIIMLEVLLLDRGCSMMWPAHDVSCT